MAKRFTRNIRSIESIEKQPKYTNEQNDLLSDDKHVYVRNQGKYEKITGNVEKVNNKEPDDSGNVEIDTGVMEVNDQTPDDSGKVEIDTGTMTVNQETPDDSGNVEIDTGVMQVNGKEPDEEGHILFEASDIPNNQNLARKEYVKKEISKIEIPEETDYNQQITITPWEDITIKNDYTASDIPDFKPSYCFVDYGSHKEVFIRFGFENLVNSKNVVGSIPSELVPNKIYRNGTTSTDKIPPKIIIITTGDIEIHPNKSDEYTDTDYVIYQGSWIIHN